MKKIVIMILITAMLAPVTGYADTYKPKYQDYAEQLKKLGVFKGTDSGFELDREPTRIEAAVMFVRLLGAEQDAIENKYEHPFTDVPEWANNYVGYLYHKKLSNGTGVTTFGTTDNIKAKSYVTFVLRALGYDDSAGDFSWLGSLEFAKTREIINDDDFTELTTTTFLRDHVAKISYFALKMPLKDSDTTLIDKLVDMNAININVNIKIENENWMYYVNGEDHCLYKLATDGSNKIKLTDDKAWFFDLQGEWIYYYGENGNIYKMTTTGKDITKINNNESGWINVVGEWIYYSNYDDNDTLYKIKIDGSKITKLNNERSYEVDVIGEWIYYIDWVAGESMYKMKVDGSNKTILCDRASKSINIIDEWIYTEISDHSVVKIYKMKTDGSNKTILNSKESSIIWIEDDWIYYREECEDQEIWDWSTYKMKTDGSNKIKLSDDDMVIIGIDGDWIYYENREDAYNTYKIKKDGTGREKI